MSELRHRKTTEESGAQRDGERNEGRREGRAKSEERRGEAWQMHPQDMADFTKEGVRLLLRRFYDKVNKGLHSPTLARSILSFSAQRTAASAFASSTAHLS